MTGANKWWPIGQRGRTVLAAGLVVVLAVGLWAWRRYGAATSPTRAGAAATIPAGDVRAAAAAHRGTTPSIPGLQKGVPQLVPGLEEVKVGWTPSLSDDLCTIVFDAIGPSGHVLYIASRPDVASPFSNAQVIRSSLPARARKPALSPDGLELIFERDTGDPPLFYCRRTSPSAEFGEAVPWPVPGMERPETQIDAVRFIDPLHVMMSAENAKFQARISFFILERADPKGTFGPPKELLMGVGCGPRACLRPNRLISYVGNENGLFVQTRKSEKEGFGAWVPLFPPAVSGPVAGPVWLPPGDDVIFYASPGPGGKLPGTKYLWMIRL